MSDADRGVTEGKQELQSCSWTGANHSFDTNVGLGNEKLQGLLSVMISAWQPERGGYQVMLRTQF